MGDAVAGGTYEPDVGRYFTCGMVVGAVVDMIRLADPMVVCGMAVLSCGGALRNEPATIGTIVGIAGGLGTSMVDLVRITRGTQHASSIHRLILRAGCLTEKNSKG